MLLAFVKACTTTRAAQSTPREPARGGGYTALVAAHSRALGKTNMDIADTIGRCRPGKSGGIRQESPGRCQMRKNIPMLLGLFFILVLPAAASADCTSPGPFDNFVVHGDDTVIPYNGSNAIVKIETNGSIDQKSKIHFTKNYVCEGDDILVDDAACNIVTVTPAD